MFRTKIKAALLLVVITLSMALVAVPARAATTISITSPTSSSTVTGDSFTVNGTATANRTVTVKVNGASVGTTTSDSGGNWSLNVTGQSVGAKTIEATASGQLIYVNTISTSPTPYTNSRMLRLNTLTNTVESSFSTFGASEAPINWKANPTFTKAYGVAPYLNSATVWVMDFVTGSTTTFTLPGSGQRGASIAYNADGSKVYITDNANTDVIVYDTTTNNQVGSAIGVGTAPHSNAHRPGTDEIWVDNSGSASLAVINTISDTVTATHAITGSPNGLVFSPDGEIAYVGTDEGSGELAIVNADTGATTSTIAGSAVPEFLTINSTGTKVYASHPSTNTIDVFDVQSGTLEDTITVATGPWGMALTADDSRLYVTSPHLFAGLTGTTIAIVDTATNTVLETITPGNGAPFYIYSAPPESDSDTVSFTLAAATSTSGTLADTGLNAQFVALAAAGMVIVGAFGIRRYVHRSSFKMGR